jgi:hypothetical protein
MACHPAPSGPATARAAGVTSRPVSARRRPAVLAWGGTNPAPTARSGRGLAQQPGEGSPDASCASGSPPGGGRCGRAGGWAKPGRRSGLLAKRSCSVDSEAHPGQRLRAGPSRGRRVIAIRTGSRPTTAASRQRTPPRRRSAALSSHRATATVIRSSEAEPCPPINDAGSPKLATSRDRRARSRVGRGPPEARGGRPLPPRPGTGCPRLASPRSRPRRREPLHGLAGRSVADAGALPSGSRANGHGRRTGGRVLPGVRRRASPGRPRASAHSPTDPAIQPWQRRSPAARARAASPPRHRTRPAARVAPACGPAPGAEGRLVGRRRGAPGRRGLSGSGGGTALAWRVRRP